MEIQTRWVNGEGMDEGLYCLGYLHLLGIYILQAIGWP
jgi:hypothetical protein